MVRRAGRVSTTPPDTLPAADVARAQTALLALADERAGEGTFCPSEAARRLGGGWRAWMPAVWAAVERLEREEAVEVLQSGRRVMLQTARGPVRLRVVR